MQPAARSAACASPAQRQLSRCGGCRHMCGSAEAEDVDASGRRAAPRGLWGIGVCFPGQQRARGAAGCTSRAGGTCWQRDDASGAARALLAMARACAVCVSRAGDVWPAWQHFSRLPASCSAARVLAGSPRARPTSAGHRVPRGGAVCDNVTFASCHGRLHRSQLACRCQHRSPVGAYIARRACVARGPGRVRRLAESQLTIFRFAPQLAARCSPGRRRGGAGIHRVQLKGCCAKFRRDVRPAAGAAQRCRLRVCRPACGCRRRASSAWSRWPGRAPHPRCSSNFCRRSGVPWSPTAPRRMSSHQTRAE